MNTNGNIRIVHWTLSDIRTAGVSFDCLITEKQTLNDDGPNGNDQFHQMYGAIRIDSSIENEMNGTSVNWKALGISLSIVGVMVLIIACCCCCYCCHYCKKCKRRWTEYNFKRQREREMAKRLAMENRQEQRRMERKAQIDAIRQKYGKL
ncbi:unnamed protein product [Anisakis simplex]|uniref:Uncharacterized protein n=1 Tax=Anisakis simplex TaxID=6269 RepID=A0A0M3KEB2_ANISI|nr:unnamed protein product [Anisakis simplex]